MRFICENMLPAKENNAYAKLQDAANNEIAGKYKINRSDMINDSDKEKI